jgi:ferredoxin
MGLAEAGTEPAMSPAVEETWAGAYTANVTPARAGLHTARIVVLEADGRKLDAPLAVELPLSIGAPPGMGAAAWTAVALLGALAAAFLYGVRARAATEGGAVDLLSISWIRRLFTSRAVAPALQIPLLGLTAVVVLLGLLDTEDGAVNLAPRLAWTIWWTAVIFTFVLAGRVWCLACPFGALNEWTARAAGPTRRLPRIFRNLWWATGAFVLLTWADEQLGIVRSPRVTAGIVLFFVALAVLVGVFFERRSFCRHLCPIGGVIGIYSMTAPVELRAKDEAVCRSHAEKSCYRGAAGAPGCPMFEFPQTMDRNNYCNLCGVCVRGCSRENLTLRLRAFGQDLWASRRRFLDESYLAAALVGLTLLVTAQMLGAWAGWISALARWLPGWIRGAVKPVTYLSAVESIVLLAGTLVIGPLLIYAASALADGLAGPRALGARRAFVVWGYMFVPVGLAVHLAHNLEHLLNEGPGIVPALQRAVALYTPLSLGAPDWNIEPLAPAPVVSLLQLSVLSAFFVLSLVAGRRMAVRDYGDTRAAGRALVPMAVLSFVFTVAGIVILNQPMAMRHGM